ncbi:fimbrial protein [Pseudomonas sp. S1Bt23]|uniref:fimbrial protein n=1 Tax=Pseudomonas sp. S1Bt23 TaxID=3095074 RepID=UPI002A5A6254|nr:fimbrial protein [Pseudomonas sp. S1Bt23]WPO48171.1 fimbrial protein [Pseudomonas sp. S1Bt23]
MSIYIKSMLAVAMTGVLANSAMAADGTINFTGEIVAASCKATAGSGSNVSGEKGAQIINVKLGKVPIDSLTGSTSIVAGTPINLDLDCGNTGTGLTLVKVQFDPRSGSGVDSSNGSLLKIAGGTGAAAGVGIGIYDLNGKLLNLGANETFNSELLKETTGTGETATTKYSAKLNMRTAYVPNGASLKAGVANGTLPFTLTYE